ncbi:hypothetical protein EVAR_59983_1 [Eumeta japonica]|uniref:Uncharacterized protein n=1 Tax=Eumeta variegata TaxID=151549 RepID=A0A4C1ZI37_EUMVA|nr:hypothetical protein EVAR_59983_1 [Eumeta japonica]
MLGQHGGFEIQTPQFEIKRFCRIYLKESSSSMKFHLRDDISDVCCEVNKRLDWPPRRRAAPAPVDETDLRTCC